MARSKSLAALVAIGAEVLPPDPGSPPEPGVLRVRGTSVDEVGAAAGRCGATVLELATEGGSLEEAYLQLTADAVEYRGRAAGEPASTAPDPEPTACESS